MCEILGPGKIYVRDLDSLLLVAPEVQRPYGTSSRLSTNFPEKGPGGFLGGAAPRVAKRVKLRRRPGFPKL
jgi:hypothetical protein